MAQVFVPEICQKLRYTQPPVGLTPDPPQRLHQCVVWAREVLRGVVTFRASMVRMGLPVRVWPGLDMPAADGVDPRVGEREWAGSGTRGCDRPCTGRQPAAAATGCVATRGRRLGWCAVAGRGDRLIAARAGCAGCRSAAAGVPLEAPPGCGCWCATWPVVLDVDSGAVQAVTGLPAGDGRSVHVEAVGEDAVVVLRRDCRGSDCAADSVVYLVRHGSTVATGWVPQPTSRPPPTARASGCSPGRTQAAPLARSGSTVGHDGRRGPAPCDAVLIDELSAGLLVYGTRPGDGSGPYSALVTADGASPASQGWSTG